jgi:uncharacterized membrane protein YesL
MNDQTTSKLFSNDTKFARFMNTLADVLGIGILWLVCSLPVITAGASATAAYYAMAKCVRHSEGSPVKEFFHSFRLNFRQSLPVTVFLELAALVLTVDMIYLWDNENQQNDAIFVVLVLVAFVLAALSVYLFPLLSRFDKNNLSLIRTGLIVTFQYFPLTLGIMFVVFGAGIGMYLMPWALLVIPGIYMYLLTFPMERVLMKLAPPVSEGSEEAEKWFYQL